MAPVHLEVLIVPSLGASVFSVGALNEKGVNLDLMANPPVLQQFGAWGTATVLATTRGHPCVNSLRFSQLAPAEPNRLVFILQGEVTIRSIL